METRTTAHASPRPRGLWLRWSSLNATVFVAAACIMTVEILSTRLVARYLGASLYTWTSAIGVVLAGISLGNYLGGRMADRFRPRPTLALTFVASSLACWFIPALNARLGDWAALGGLSWPTRIFLHFSIVFLLPSTLLGTISPVVAKMALGIGLGTGRTVGTIYAWGSIGSIVGTFASGFWLVAWTGTEHAILIVSGVLALMGMAFGFRSWVSRAWAGTYTAGLVCVLAPWGWTARFESLLGLRDPASDLAVFLEDSRYQRVMVVRQGGSRRAIQLDNLVHGRVDMTDPLRLLYGYPPIFAEVVHSWDPSNEPVRALFIGGGGCVFPRYLEIVRPGSDIEVAEIDPVVTRAAFEGLGLPSTTTIRIFDMDARNRLTDLARRASSGDPVPPFDCVFGDAFSDLSVPFHLVTQEFNRLLDGLMSERGLYLLNVIDSLDSGAMLAATIHTCRQVFPHVYVVEPDIGGTGRNTFVVVSARRPLDLSGLTAAVLDRHGARCRVLSDADVDRLVARHGERLLTDDHAPVENLLAAVVRGRSAGPAVEAPASAELADLFADGDLDAVLRRGRELLARDSLTPGVNLWMGRALRRQERLTEAVERFRAELAVDPSAWQAHVGLGRTLERLGEIERAIDSFRLAARARPDDPEVACALAGALASARRYAEAETRYRAVIDARPGYVDAHLGLARVAGQRHDASASIPHYERALELDPDRPGLHFELGRCFFRAGRPAEAAEHFRAAVQRQPESAELHNHLARSLARSGDLEAAAVVFARVVELEPGRPLFHANLGLVNEQLGRHEAAIAAYRECVRLDPAGRAPAIALARLLATASGEPGAASEAVRLAERLCASAADPEPEALDALAMAYASAGRFEDAVANAERALERAEAGGRAELAAEIRRRLEAFRGGRAVRREP